MEGRCCRQGRRDTMGLSNESGSLEVKREEGLLVMVLPAAALPPLVCWCCAAASENGMLGADFSLRIIFATILLASQDD